MLIDIVDCLPQEFVARMALDVLGFWITVESKEVRVGGKILLDFSNGSP